MITRTHPPLWRPGRWFSFLRASGWLIRFALPCLLFALTAGAITFPPTATVPLHALRFLGANQYVEVPHAAYFNVSNQFTLEAWINITAFGPNTMAFVTKGDDLGLVRSGTSSKLSFRTKSGNTVDDLVTTVDLVVGRWYHVAAVYDGATKLLYLDDQLHTSKAYSSPVNLNTVPIDFGANAASANKNLNGQLDTIRLWSVPRSLTQIKADIDRDLYGDEPGLLGEWRFDEASGSVAKDSSVGAHDGTLFNMTAADRVNGIGFRPPPPRSTVPASALRLSGDDHQFVAVNDRYETDFDLTGTTLTLEAWINIAAFDQPWQAIVTKGEAWGLTRSNATSKLSFRTKTGAVINDLGTTSDFLSNRWYHVAAVFTGTQKLIYVDGVLDASASYNLPLVANNIPVVIGANGETTGRGFHGDIDTVRIWSSARTAADINANMLSDLRGSESSLLGDWRFNEGAGTVAIDSSYGERHATLVSMTDVVNRVAGLAFAPAAPPTSVGTTGALHFSGVNGALEPRVIIPSESQFDLAQELTIEAWVYVEAFDQPWQAIITKGDAWGLVRYNETGRVAFRSQQGLGFDDLYSATELQLNRWYHVAAVFDGTQKRLYLDGKLEAVGPLATPLETNDQPVVIGANAAQPGRGFHGRLDAVRIWSVARSADQIQQQLSRDLRGSETGLLGEWRFNETSGTSATDSSMRQLNGALTDMSLPADRVGGLPFRAPADGQLAIAFNQAGVQKQFVTLPDESRFDFSNQLTAEAWVYFDDLPATTVALVSKGASAWQLRLRPTGKIQFSTAGLSDPDPQAVPPTDLVSVSALPTKAWTHVAATWDAVGGMKAIYLNGVLDVAHSGITGTLSQNNLPVLFGAEPLTAGQGSHFQGILDEVRLWTSARLGERILDNYTRRLTGIEPQLAGVWSFNEGSGGTVFDGRAGSTTHGTLAPGMTTWNRVDGQALGEPSTAQYALSFNGVDEYVEVPDNPALTFTGKATFEAWVNPTGTGWRTILSKGATAYGLAVDDQNRLRFYIDGVSAHALASDTRLANDVWQHVAVVVNNAPAGTRFYINGKLAGASTTAVLANQAGPLWLGRRSATAPGDYFRGQMDEVRLWNVARSDGEIDFLAFRSPPGQTLGLRAYWGFNEARGTVLHDLTATRADGALVNLDDSNWTGGKLWGAGTVDPSLVLQPDPNGRGLWIGNVTLKQVNEVGQALNGAAENTTTVGDEASVRLLLHVDGSGRARMLKDVIVMQTLTNPQDPASAKRVVLVTDPARISQFQGIVQRGGKLVGVRHGTVAYDFAGFDLPLIGGVGPGVGCAGTIALAKDAATNPFRHRFHSDHREGFDIGRQFSIQFNGAPGNALVEGPNYGVQRLTGTYKETITGLHKIPLKVQGAVTLDRVSTVDVLNDGKF